VKCWSVVAGSLLALAAVSSALADGIGVPGGYRYVYPPRFLKAGNIAPTGARQTNPLASNIPVYVSPSDGQATLTYNRGDFGFPPGQRSLFVGIQPLRHYVSPERGQLLLDGNVYGFTFRFRPSGITPTFAVRPIVVGMAAPHTPNDLVGYVNGGWITLCSQTELLFTPSSVDCYTKRAVREVALIYLPFGLRHKLPPRKQPFPIFTVIAIMIVIVWVAIVAILLQRRRARRAVANRPRR
jgi:hypothetical protein